MRRSFTEILSQESPIALAREALWRTQKGWRRKRLLVQLDRAQCPVKFRNMPYYAPNVPALTQNSKTIVVDYANEIGRGRFSFLGYGTQHLGYEPSWNLDFISGHQWTPIGTNNYGGLDATGVDIKVPWELSRLQFLPILGKAFVITGDERYREDAKRLMSHWIMKNPVGAGVNWAIAMEAALRGMSICFLLNLLSPMRPEEQNWLRIVTGSLWHHLLFIEAHVEFSHLIRSNHYLSNVIGLYCLSEFLEGTGMPERRRIYRRKVESEILRQVYEDGGNYEASTGYHVLVTQMFTSSLLLMRAAHVAPEPRFLERLRRMYSFMDRLANSSGQLPHIGDCDDGRIELLLDDLNQMLALPVPERNSLRISNLLGIGRCLFGSDRGSTEDARWYGLDAADAPVFPGGWEAPVARTPELAAFPQSGIGTAAKDRAEVLFFALPNGISGKGSHNHNDKLSFVLRLDGNEVLCDSGTYTYTRNPELRNRFRSTAAHNTVLIDSEEQNTIDGGRAGLFYLGNQAQVSPIESTKEGDDLILHASHAGYQRLGIKHTRTVRLRANRNMVIVEDKLNGSGTHSFEINFQFASEWRIGPIETVGSNIQARAFGSAGLQISFEGADRAEGEKQDSSVSMTYGGSSPAERLSIKGESNLPATLTTVIRWSTPAATSDEKKTGASHA
jgi:hypothetical protein